MDISRVYRQTDNPVLTLFMSPYNMGLLRSAIVDYIKKATDITISEQSDRDLFGVMQFIYNQYANTTCYDSLTSEVRKLNTLVIQESVYNIKSGMLMYFQYVKDASTLPVPIDRAAQTTTDKSIVFTEDFI